MSLPRGGLIILYCVTETTLFATGPTELVSGDDGWTVSGRPDLVLQTAGNGVRIDTRPSYQLLYTLDDFGRLTILDAQPVQQ
jgi:hypothetical protein